MKQTVDLVLRNCKIVTSSGIQEAGIAVEQERIAQIAKDSRLAKADQTIDCRGKLVIPGGVDVHVHFKTHRENWKTASESAAAGGVTFVADHGLTEPPSTTLQNWRELKADACSKSIIDFTINGSVAQHNLTELPKLAKAGVSAFGEVYMAESVEGSETIDDGTLFEAFRTIAETGCVVGVHAENGEIITHITRKLKQQNRCDPLAHIQARPNFAEAEAVGRAMIFASQAGVRLHIYHLTTEEGIRIVADAKRKGQTVTAETCPHYLLFDKDDMRKYGPYIKCNPPIRSKQDQEALWTALAIGDIDMVSTDHWPSLRSEKEVGWKNIWEADSGMPGVETRIPLLMTFGVKKHRISIERFVEVISEEPARAFGFYPRKGTISVGSDADLCVLDTKEKMILKAEKLHSTSDFTPYEGWEVTGLPAMTIVRGHMVMRDGQVIGKAGCGRFIEKLHRL
jgi:dihydroorotase